MPKPIETNSKPAGLFHGRVITEANVQAAAETLWTETYGNLAGLRDGMTYVLHLYPDDGDCTVKLEDRMTEVRRDGSVVAAPVLSHRAEWSEPDDLPYLDYKQDFVDGWADQIRDNLDPIEEPEAAGE